MKTYPAVIVHGLADAVAVLAQAEAEGAAVTLVSAPGAALNAGCGWWRALVDAARAGHAAVPCVDILDCADGTGQALAALRIGLTRLVLWPNAPAREAVVAIAEAMGGFVLPAAPPLKAAVTIARVNLGARSKAAAASAGHPSEAVGHTGLADPSVNPPGEPHGANPTGRTPRGER